MWMDPIVEEVPAKPAFPAWNLRVGGKCLLAIYLPCAAFDTWWASVIRLSPPQEAGFFSPHSARHCLLLCACFVSVFFAQTVHFEGTTNPRQAPQLCHCRETDRASHTATPSKGGRDANSFEEAFLKQKGFPYGLVCLTILSFPPHWAELTDGWLSIRTYQDLCCQINK